MGLEYYEGSAKTGAGIKEFFKVLTYKLAGASDNKKDGNDSGKKKENIVAPQRTPGTPLVNPKDQEKKKDKSCSC